MKILYGEHGYYLSNIDAHYLTTFFLKSRQPHQNNIIHIKRKVKDELT